MRRLDKNKSKEFWKVFFSETEREKHLRKMRSYDEQIRVNIQVIDFLKLVILLKKKDKSLGSTTKEKRINETKSLIEIWKERQKGIELQKETCEKVWRQIHGEDK